MSVLKQIFEKKITSIEKKKKLKSIDQLENEINIFLEKVVADFLRGTDAKS